MKEIVLTHEGNIMNLIKRDGFLVALMCALIFCAYVPTFSGEFILDDRPFVKDNTFIREFHSPVSYLSQMDGIEGDLPGRLRSAYYRPLINLSYTLDLKLWGMNAGGFRATNLVLHIFTCLLLYLVFGMILGSTTAVLPAVLLFGLHPANTETVSWVTSRNNILVTLFSLASFYFYMKRDRDSGRWSGPLSLFFFAMALLSKEFAVMLLPILFLYDRFLAPGRKSLSNNLWGYAAFLLMIICYLLLRRFALQDIVPPRDLSQVWRALLFAPYLILFNLRILLVPLGLHNFMVSYPGDDGAGEMLLGFAGAGLLLWSLWRRRSQGVLVFSIIAFLAGLFPVLNIIPTSAYSLVSMRWLYFPMSFLIIAAAAGMKHLEKGARPILWYLLIIPGIMYLGAYTHILNQNHWLNEEDFFRNEVLAFDNGFYAGDLARKFHETGNYREAEKFYEIATRKFPDKASLLIDHAALLVDMDLPERALPLLERAESADLSTGERGALFNNRGAAYFRLKEYDRAVRALKMCVALKPDEVSYRMNLGSAYGASGQYRKAAAEFRGCLDLDPGNSQAWKNLGMNLMRLGEHADAVRAFEKIPLEVTNRDPSIHELLGEARQKASTGAPAGE